MTAHQSIETPRLRLSAFTPELLLALIEQPERFETLAGVPAATGLREFFVSGELSPQFVAGLRTSQAYDPWRNGFAVVHPESRSVIGTAGFKGPPDAAEAAEIAYAIVPAFEGRGYATEAATALVDFAAASGRVKRVVAHTLPERNASGRVLAKCGFRRTGEVEDPDDGTVWRWERDALVAPAWSVHRAGAVDDTQIGELAELLIDCVEGGASVSFMHPLSRDRAVAFWRGVADDVTAGDRALLVARDALGVCGTVQLVLAQPENQPHRAELAKMLVHRRVRRQGVGAALMRLAETTARECGKSLLVLDAVTDGDAARLYERLGWVRVGVIPGYALMPRGEVTGTTVYYRELGA